MYSVSATFRPFSAKSNFVLNDCWSPYADKDGVCKVLEHPVNKSQYPSKQKQRIEFTVPDDAEGQTFNMPDVILEDNV